MKDLSTIGRALAATLVALASGTGAWLPTDAAAGTYEVVQCDRANREYADARFDRVNGGDYGFLYRCEEDEDANALQIRTITGSPKGRYGRISWLAPAGTRIAAVEAEARLRDDAGHEARLAWLGEDGSEAGRVAGGSAEATGFRGFRREASGGGRGGFAAILGCEGRGGCPRSERAKAWIRSVHLTIADGGPLGDPGRIAELGRLASRARDPRRRRLR
jgi:hypothetical protein